MHAWQASSPLRADEAADGSGGAADGGGLQMVLLELDGMSCAACAAKVEGAPHSSPHAAVALLASEPACSFTQATLSPSDLAV